MTMIANGKTDRVSRRLRPATATHSTDGRPAHGGHQAAIRSPFREKASSDDGIR
jgi:hypothetical protein